MFCFLGNCVCGSYTSLVKDFIQNNRCSQKQLHQPVSSKKCGYVIQQQLLWYPQLTNHDSPDASKISLFNKKNREKKTSPPLSHPPRWNSQKKMWRLTTPMARRDRRWHRHDSSAFVIRHHYFEHLRMIDLLMGIHGIKIPRYSIRYFKKHIKKVQQQTNMRCVGCWKISRNICQVSGIGFIDDTKLPTVRS